MALKWGDSRREEMVANKMKMGSKPKKILFEIQTRDMSTGVEGEGWDSQGCKFRTFGLTQGVLVKTPSCLAVKVSFRVAHEKYNNIYLRCIFLMHFNFNNISQVFSFVCVLMWPLLGVKKSLGHAQIGLLQGFNSKFLTSIFITFICGVAPPRTCPAPHTCFQTVTQKKNKRQLAVQLPLGIPIKMTIIEKQQAR